MDVHFCVEALEEAMAVHGAPDIMNTDQSAQFASQAFTGLLKQHGIRISMDGKGSWRDNVKYEEVYLHAYDTVSESRAGIGRHFNPYNQKRAHSSLQRQTPDHVTRNRMQLSPNKALPLSLVARRHSEKSR
jgi:putative transposase